MWTSAGKIRYSHTVGEFGLAFFRSKNVLKFNFHNCKGSLMLVDSSFSAGKIR